MANTRFSLTELISTAKKLVDELSNFKTDTESVSGTKLEESMQLIEKIKEEYFEQGENGILEKITHSITRIQTFVERSKEISSVINVDISDCINGKQEELEALGKNLITDFISAATKIINKAIDNINSRINIIKEITNELSDLPSKLRSKLFMMNMKAINEFVEYVQDLIQKLPEQVSNIVRETSNFVQNLPAELLVCVQNSVGKAETDTNNLLQNTAQSIGAKFATAIIDYLLS